MILTQAELVGELNETRTVFIDSEANRQVNFTATLDESGTVDVMIDGTTYGIVTIETPTTKTTPAMTPSPTAAETHTERSPPPEEDSYFVGVSGLGIIIAAIIGLLLIVYLIFRWRRGRRGEDHF